MTKIAINTYTLDGKIPSGDRRWAAYNDSFENVDLDLMDIANAIYTGHAYAAWHDGRRSIDNFLLAQHIAIDMDTGDERSTLEALQGHSLVRGYASLMHTTPSHTVAEPRARVIFLLDTAITDAMAYQAAASFLIAQFDGADSACKDASRFFYGCKDAHIWVSENILPLPQLRHYYRRWNKSQPRPRNIPRTQPEHSQNNNTTPATQILDKVIAKAQNGNRNRLGYWFACVLRDDGVSRTEAEQSMRSYQRAVEHLGTDPYTETEATITLKSAYKGH